MDSHFDPSRDRFRTTSWSLIATAAKHSADGHTDSQLQRQAANAIERLCRAYWYSVYSFARRSG